MREMTFKRRLIEQAQIQPGDRVLDLDSVLSGSRARASMSRSCCSKSRCGVVMPMPSVARMMNDSTGMSAFSWSRSVGGVGGGFIFLVSNCYALAHAPNSHWRELRTAASAIPIRVQPVGHRLKR